MGGVARVVDFSPPVAIWPLSFWSRSSAPAARAHRAVSLACAGCRQQAEVLPGADQDTSSDGYPVLTCPFCHSTCVRSTEAR